MGLLGETANPFYIWLTHEIRCLGLSKALFPQGRAARGLCGQLSTACALAFGEPTSHWPDGGTGTGLRACVCVDTKGRKGVAEGKRQVLGEVE